MGIINSFDNGLPANAPVSLRRSSPVSLPRAKNFLRQPPQFPLPARLFYQEIFIFHIENIEDDEVTWLMMCIIIHDIVYLLRNNIIVCSDI